MTSPDEKLRILIVDDEPLARERLRDLLETCSRLKDITEAGDGEAAVAIIEKSKTDLVFLDIQMPGLTGMGVVNTIGADAMPMTVFVTAYDNHAVQAFEANALDYLLKPVSEARFAITMQRIEAKLAAPNREQLSRQLAQVAADLPPKEQWDRLVIKTGGTTRFLPIAEIDLIEAAGVYVTLFVEGKEILYRAPLHLLAEKLDPKRFIRVHRSSIVNIESVLQLDTVSHGEFEVTLKHGARAKVSRSYRANLEQRLGQAL